MTAGRKINTKNQNWGTPKQYIDAIKEFFNGSIFFRPMF